MNKNKSKKETKHASLVGKWVGIVALTITVSFVVFSVIIYSIVKQQFLSQEQNITEDVVTTLQQKMENIPEKLEISNVVPNLSPSTSRILEGKSALSSEDRDNNVFSDDVLASLTNRDTSVVIYSTNGEVTFSNGTANPTLKRYQADHVIRTVKRDNGINLVITQKIHANRTGQLTGYLVVSNAMSDFNRVLSRLRYWMTIWSILAIAIFVLSSYVVVRNIVKPIRIMSKVVRHVNESPESDDRIPDLHRRDELGQLGVFLNEMLDRMQKYIDQQKQFVGDVSHELRTPVAVIQGHLNLLQRWGKKDPQVLDESLNESLQEANRMKHLIQEMLDLTRAEQIDIQYPNEVTDVYEVVNHVVADMRMIHQDFVIRLDDEGLKPGTKIQIYRNHLEQLLIILIDNAIKYSIDRKEIIVTADISDGQVELMVQDFGEGIAADEKDKIFNRFYRVDKARTREKGGNGLGLSIAKKLVQSYHGQIDLDSVEGAGSQFKLSFPLLTKKQLGKKPQTKIEKAQAKLDQLDHQDRIDSVKKTLPAGIKPVDSSSSQDKSD